ncbi:uncharacterized protein [Miscanthus floridulus]|uniref:uncharacterized protein n=1 Tax=Miscanthus floridulus TaxID=154761 RepID=UPI003458663C
MKVLMDGGSGLNIMYADTLDHMGISRKDLRPSGAPFFRIIPRAQATPLRSIHLPVTFGEPANFRNEYLDFEVVDFASPYRALLGPPCYMKFMAIPHYGCLKLKIPNPRGVIMVATSMAKVYHCKQEGTTLFVASITTIDFA